MKKFFLFPILFFFIFSATKSKRYASVKALFSILMIILSQPSNASCLVHLVASNMIIFYEKNPHYDNLIKVNVSIKNTLKVSENKNAKLKGIMLSVGKPYLRIDLATETDGVITKASFDIDSSESYENYWILATLEPDFAYEKSDDCELSYDVAQKLKHNQSLKQKE